MVRLKVLGWGVRRIARELGCSPKTVRGGWRVDAVPHARSAAELVFVAIERSTRFIERGTRFAHVEVLADRRAETVPAPGRASSTPSATRSTRCFGDGTKAGHAARPTGRRHFDRLCAERGVSHRLTRPYRPRTNGLAERFNRRLGEAMGARPQLRDDSRHRTRFASHAERAAFLDDFVEG